MVERHDLIVRGGTIVDGLGGAPFVGDIAIRDGRIVQVGAVTGAAEEELSAKGLLVTPGFVDVHTHYDGQVTWEQTTGPSANHGVTTIVTGNCGVGFAPCRPEDRMRLVRLMEGVEDIPEVVMTEGLPWSWESFPDYLDQVAASPRDVDVAALLPHSCLRVFVMGQRGADREPATAADLAEMKRLTTEAMRAGAFGVGTSRTLFHKSSEGAFTPSKDAAESELHALGQGMKEAGRGVLQVVPEMLDSRDFADELRLLGRVGSASGRPVTFSLVQLLDAPDVWATGLEVMDAINRDGVKMTAQVMGRPIGLLLGLNMSFNPFSLHPTYRSLARLSLADRVTELRRPEIRETILAERAHPLDTDQALLRYISAFDKMFSLGDPPNYVPKPDQSVAAQAKARGVRPEEVIYDILLERGGESSLFLTFANYAEGNLDPVFRMINDQNTIIGLGDGGAHYGMICDAGYPTFMLTYWARDRADGERIPLEKIVRWLTHDPAETLGLSDRGRIAVGYKANLNLIDYAGLRLHPPRATYDLPGGGRRLTQGATGYVATLVNGVATYRDGKPTGALPGGLVRNPEAPGRAPA